ncbi:MAG: tripartite tricarboxylate transporter substrate binding protein [Betaproteobacteria bacterium]|nr:tripartite tricarboxylate transporter substrate binding protein [Betaproteobacteria bacterium]
MKIFYRNLYCNTALLIAGLLFVFGWSSGVLAQDPFPAKPLRVIVPWPPGGPPDVAMRLLAPKLTEGWGRAVVVENRAGATGTIGSDLVAKSAPDGHTLLFTSNQPLAIAPSLFKVPYDTKKDFVPVAIVTDEALVLVVNANLGINSVAGLLAAARAKPGTLSYGTAGIGSFGHLAGEFVNMLAGINLVHVPYQGTAQTIAPLLTGEISLGFPPPLPVLAHIKSGKLRALGVTSPKPSSLLPDIPPLNNLGLEGLVITTWSGALLPARTPQVLVRAWSDALRSALLDEGLRQKLRSAGINNPEWQDGERMAELMDADIAKYRKVIAAAKIVAQ